MTWDEFYALLAPRTLTRQAERFPTLAEMQEKCAAGDFTPITEREKWVPIGTPSNKDWVKVGSWGNRNGNNPCGMSAVIDLGAYPEWGDVNCTITPYRSDGHLFKENWDCSDDTFLTSTDTEINLT